MISFKDFQQIMLLEYLTPEQEAQYSKYKISKEAKDSTDHFFGKDSDVVRGVLDHSETHHPQKSEVHQKIEKHLGTTIEPDDYIKGTTKDSYGREVKIGRLLKDEKLKNEFASDNTRAASKKTLNQYTTSTHRGTQVAGQTNSEHSWSSQSCKHIETGSNRKYLPKEISKGTVVHFVHDEKGKEIYRSTLQPYRNKEGDTLYHLDAEYGVKHPSFTKSSKETAEKLSTPKPKSMFGFKATPEVYNNSKQYNLMHPTATPEHISKALEDEDEDVRMAAIEHPKATPEHISKALRDKYAGVRISAIEHPKASPEHISKALKDKDVYVREAAIEHPKATPEHISKALEDEDAYVRKSAIKHPNATPEHISKALEDKVYSVRAAAIRHPKATSEHISKALGDKDEYVRAAAMLKLK